MTLFTKQLQAVRSVPPACLHCRPRIADRRSGGPFPSGTGHGQGGEGGSLRVSWVGRWEAGLDDQARAAAEDGDAGDARGGDGEDGDAEGVVGPVAIAVVGGRGGLAVGDGGGYQPVSG